MSTATSVLETAFAIVRARVGSRSFALAALLLLVVLAAGAPALHVPPGLDQGILAYIGGDILDGGVPYLTSWDHKPPGAYYLFALGFALFGRSVEAIRAFDLVYVYAIALALSALMVRLFDRLAGFAAGCVFAISYFSRLSWWDMAQPDEYMLLPLLLGLLLVTVPPERRRLGHELLAGLCFGFAFIVKFVSLAALVPAAFVLASEFLANRNLRAATRALGATALGFVAINAALLLYLLSHGALTNFVESQTVFNRGYVLQGFRGPPSDILAAYDTFQPYVALALSAFAALVFALPLPSVVRFRREQQLGWRSFGFVVLLLFGIAAEIIAQAKFYAYHYTPLLLALAMFAGIGLSALCGLCARRLRLGSGLRAAVQALIAVPLIAGCVAPRAEHELAKYRALSAYLRGREDSDAYYAQFGGYGDRGGFSYLACLRAAAYVREHSQPRDRVYLWGFDPLLPFLAQRKLASRFTYNTPLIVHWGRAAWRREFMAELESAPPKFMLFLRNDQHPWTTGRQQDSYDVMRQDFPVLVAFLHDKYKFSKAIEDYRIYRRRD